SRQHQGIFRQESSHHALRTAPHLPRVYHYSSTCFCLRQGAVLSTTDTPPLARCNTAPRSGESELGQSRAPIPLLSALLGKRSLAAENLPFRRLSPRKQDVRIGYLR